MSKNSDSPFRYKLGETVFQERMIRDDIQTWRDLAYTVAHDVCDGILSTELVIEIAEAINNMEFMPGGRYLAYAGRPLKYFQNCYAFKSKHDTREDWANLYHKAASALMTGGGIGNDYSIYRAHGAPLARTGGIASGPLPLMEAVNGVGRASVQGGGRRAAIYASLAREHGDIFEFLKMKNWNDMKIPGARTTIADAKQKDFSFHAPMDHTNISANYSDEWLALGDYAITPQNKLLMLARDKVFYENCLQAMKTGEPGFSFNFGEQREFTARNAPVSGDTWVLTSDGHRQIKNIVDTPTTIWTGKQWASDVEFKRTKEMTETVIVQMTGGREIQADPEHPFFVERYPGKCRKGIEPTIEKVNAGDLEPGDILHVSLCKDDNHDNRREYDYVLGYAYGDGSFKDGGQVDITFCSQESQQIAKDIDWESVSQDAYINWNDGRNFVRAHIPRFHSGLNKRSAPSYIKDKQSFIAGLFDADGNWDASQRSVRLCSKHNEFLHDIRRMLESLGIISHVSKNGISTYGKSQCYQLVVARDCVTRFADIIPTRRIKPIGYDSYRKSLIKVISVEDGPLQDVYCCDVKVKEHSFEAEGVIISNCTEFITDEDGDACNLGSINMSRINTLERFSQVCRLGAMFLYCGTMRAMTPTPEIKEIRDRNRRIGLGLMGVHEWLIRRGYEYKMNYELREWMQAYATESESGANEVADAKGLPRPRAYRAIAPTGTIGIYAGTTTGIEPIFATAFKRWYMVGQKHKFQYVVDPTAKVIANELDIDIESIETSFDLSKDIKRRIEFQADIQDFVDMGISSTLNLPEWGSEHNNENKVMDFAVTLAKFAPRLRGLTCYPNGARGGQPLEPVSFAEASKYENEVYNKETAPKYTEEVVDVCNLSGKGTCNG